MQLEIPYVSASQRPTKQAIQEQNETIIVAGQARQKRKRRAGKHAGDLEADTPSTDKNERSTSENTQGGPKTTEHQEPFDFSSIPNILDDGQDTGNGGEEMSDKRRKKQKKSNNKGLSQSSYFRSSSRKLTALFRGEFLWRLPCSSEGA